jgi:hypothetical protein
MVLTDPRANLMMLAASRCNHQAIAATASGREVLTGPGLAMLMPQRAAIYLRVSTQDQLSC